MKRAIPYLITSALALSLGSCSKHKKHNKRTSGGEDQTVAECTEPPKSQDAEIVTKTVLHSLRFHTPEQLNRSLEKSFGVKLKDGSLDTIAVRLNFVLGGIDHHMVDRRDPVSKAQTILAAQHVAWLVAQALVAKEAPLPAAERLVLKFADLQAVPEATEGAWKDQVEQLYWIAYARQPTASDLERGWAAFQEMAADLDPAQGARAAWTGLIFALIASEEFWFA